MEKILSEDKSSNNLKHLNKNQMKEEEENKKRKLEYVNNLSNKKQKTIKKRVKEISKEHYEEDKKISNNEIEKIDKKNNADTEKKDKCITSKDLNTIDSLFNEINEKEEKTNHEKINKEEDKKIIYDNIDKLPSLIENDSTYKEKFDNYVSIDCEMVGVGPEGKESALARVSIVNYYGNVILDKFVLPREKVVDYRTHVSGITKEILKDAEPFLEVQKEVADILKNKLVIGHSLEHDFNALLLDHPSKLIRDTSHYKPFRKITNGSTPSLKKLTKAILGLDVQAGEHSSVRGKIIEI